MSSKGTVRTCT